MVHRHTCQGTLRCYGEIRCLRARLLGQQGLPRGRQGVPDSVKRKDRSAKSVIAFSKEKELPAPLPLPGQPGIVMGSFIDWAADDLGGQLKARSAPANFSEAEVPVWQESTLSRAPVPDESALSAEHPSLQHWGGEIVIVPIPGTDGGFVGQGNRFRDKLDEDTEAEY